ARKARLTLPAIVDRNFSIGADTNHSVWIESRQALSASGLAASRVEPRLFRVAGMLGDPELSARRQTITVDRSGDAGHRVASIDGGERIAQEITRREPIGALMLVIDGSAGLAESSGGLVAALFALPPRTPGGAIVASEPLQQVPLAPWPADQTHAVLRLVLPPRFPGGQDNGPALAGARRVLEAEPQATLLWIHGPQPVSFRGSAARLEQATARL